MNRHWLLVSAIFSLLGGVQGDAYSELGTCFDKENFAVDDEFDYSVENFCQYTMDSIQNCFDSFFSSHGLNPAQKTFLEQRIGEINARKAAYCATADGMKQLLKEYLCYMMRPALAPLYYCGLIMTNLTKVLAQSVSSNGIALDDAVADVLCLNAQLARQCYQTKAEEGDWAKCPHEPSYIKAVMLRQLEVDFLDNFLQLLYKGKRTCSPNLIMDAVLSRFPDDFQNAFKEVYKWNSKLKMRPDRPFELAFPSLVKLLEKSQTYYRSIADDIEEEDERESECIVTGELLDAKRE